MPRKRANLRKNQNKSTARNRRLQAKQNRKTPQVSTKENKMLREIRIKINEWSKSKNDIRIALRNFIDVAGELKAQFHKPKILLGELGIERSAEDMSYLYKLIRAVHVEFILNLEKGEVPYSVLAALPKKNLLEIWESANELKEDRPYPSEKDIAKAKKNAKKISSEEAMAKHDEYLEDVDESEDEVSEHEDKVTPNLRRDILKLSREGPKKTEIMFNIFEYLERKELLKILAIMKNFTPTEIEKTINKLKKKYPIVNDSQSDLADVQALAVYKKTVRGKR